MNVKLHKIVIRMSKLAIYAIVISQSFLMAMANESNAQGKYLKEIYVNLDFEGSTIDLKDLIEKVEASSKFNFAYSKRDIKSKEINVHSGEWNLMKLLNEVSLQGEFSIRRIKSFGSKNKIFRFRRTWRFHGGNVGFYRSRWKKN